jgi:hypothetical protein
MGDHWTLKSRGKRDRVLGHAFTLINLTASCEEAPRQDDVRMCLPEDHIAQCCIFFGAKIPGTMMVLVELMK